MPTDRHADSVALVEPVKAPEPAPVVAGQQPAIDNAAQAALAERERSFDVGGDTEGEGRPPGAPVGEAPPSLVASAVGRITALERPSPFGVAQFPPLPVPREQA